MIWVEAVAESRLVNKQGGRLIPGRRNSQWQKFLPKNRHVAGGLDSQADFTPINVNDRNANVFSDLNLFSKFPTQHQHVATLLCAKLWVLLIPLYRMNPEEPGVASGVFS
jgi:hypothetical protein